MLAKDIVGKIGWNLSERREIGYTRLSVKKQKIKKKKTDRAKYYNLLRVLAQSILPIARTPAEQNSLEFGRLQSTSPNHGLISKRSKQLGDQRKKKKKPC